MNTALVFPGQGSQYVGMGADFLDAGEQVDWFGEVCDRLDFPLRQLITEGPEEELQRTRYTQPAVFVVNHLIHRFITEKVDSNISFYAGHSLGEYNALVAADRISFDELLPVVVARGEAMDDAAQTAEGTMAAILRFNADELEDICSSVSEDSDVRGTAQVALYNSPAQLVVSGSNEAVEKVVQKASEAGALKAVTLDVSGPWHSQYMESAEGPLRQALEDIDWKEGRPVVTNVSAQEREIDNFSGDLIDQLTTPVQWTDSVQNMVDSGVRRFVEVGPGDALKGMIERISGDIEADLEVMNTDTVENTKQTVEEL